MANGLTWTIRSGWGRELCGIPLVGFRELIRRIGLDYESPPTRSDNDLVPRVEVFGK